MKVNAFGENIIEFTSHINSGTLLTYAKQAGVDIGNTYAELDALHEKLFRFIRSFPNIEGENFSVQVVNALKILDSSEGILDIDGNLCKVTDIWENDDVLYTACFCLDGIDDFTYVRCSDFEDTLTYEFWSRTVEHEDAESAFLDEKSMLELDRYEAEYGADSERACPCVMYVC